MTASVNPAPRKDSTDQGLLIKLSDYVNDGMNGAFGSLGYSLGMRPFSYMALTVFILIVSLSGFIGGFDRESRAEFLWIPQGTQATKDQAKFGESFNNPFRVSYAIIEPKSRGNVLTKEHLLEFMDLHVAVEGVVATAPDPRAVPASEADVNWMLNGVCFLLPDDGHPCFITSVLQLWDYDKPTLVADADFMQTLKTAHAADAQELERFLSEFRENADGSLFASAAKATYYIENRQVNVGGDFEDLPADAWEEGFLNVVEDCQPSLDCYRFSTRSFSDEFGAAIGGDVVLMNIGFLVIIIYLCFNLGKCGDSIGSRVGLSLISVLGIIMAIAASTGVSQLCGWPYTPVHSVLPFVLLGLGVDDSFVIMNAFVQTDISMGLPDRMRLAMGHAGVSITVTSLTDFVAFGISTSTSLPALASFCFYAATGIIFLFAFQCIFFGAYIIIDARRQEQRRVDCFCCITAKVDDEKDRRRIESDALPGRISRFMRGTFAPFITNPKFMPFIFAAALVLAGVGTFGATQLKVESNQLDFVPDGSYIIETFAKNDDLFSGDGSRVSVVTQEFDYFARQQDVYDIRDALDGKAFLQTTLGPEFDSWYHSYVLYFQAGCNTQCVGAGVVNGLPSVEAEFWSNLETFLAGPGAGYASSIIYTDDTKTAIKTAKIDLKYDPKINDEADLQVKAMEQLRDEVAKFDIPAYAYTFEFLNWETFIVIRQEMITNVGLCLLAVFCITLVLIANPITAGLVFVAVLFSVIEILGAMYFWGLVIDNVSVINLTLAVGLAIDYSAHVAHCFMLKGGPSNTLRVIESLSDIGAPVLNGAISTFLAVLVLVFSQSYVFRVLFKQFFLTCLFGVANGMITLPVMLVWFGPPAYSTAHVYEEGKMVKGANVIDSEL